MREHQTLFGVFYNGRQYRECLINQGYLDLGWVNGWSSKERMIWEMQKTLEKNIESLQWNSSGSDVTYVLHENKVFCSVDMGD